MPKSHRYNAEQWESMNRPEMQDAIRHKLDDYLRCFIDTTPDGQTFERAKELLGIVKRCFERELREAEGTSSGVEAIERYGSIEQVLAALTAAIERLPTDETMRTAVDTINAAPPPTGEELAKRKKALESLEEMLGKEGKKGWWD